MIFYYCYFLWLILYLLFSGEDTMVIGNNNVFEVDCRVESKKIGDNNIVESKGKLNGIVLTICNH
jgi:hypothetical protein